MGAWGMLEALTQSIERNERDGWQRIKTNFTKIMWGAAREEDDEHLDNMKSDPTTIDRRLIRI